MPEQRNSSGSASFAEGLFTSQIWRRRFRRHPEVPTAAECLNAFDTPN
jgi:hypothetical protein